VKSSSALPSELPIFRALPERTAALLLPMLHPQHLPKNDRVFEQGDPAEKIYTVLEGQVDIIFHPDDGGSILAAVIRPGEVFGLSAALGRRLYTSGAQAAQDSEVVWFTREDLRRYCRADPESGEIMLERLAHAMSGRLGKPPDDIVRNLHRTLMRGWEVKGVPAAGNGGEP
jgi:CRP-like cAMP-binding protein